MEEHPIQQPIRSIDVNGNYDGGYAVDYDGITRIEACQKAGLHSNLPYVRVWKGDVCVAEFCQHNIVGVYFADPTPAEPKEPTAGGWPADHDPNSPCCTCTECIPF